MNRSLPFVLAMLAVIAACDANNSTGPQVGTVKGSLSSSLGGALVGVRVVVYPFQGESAVLHTSSSGAWQVSNVSIGPGTVQVESLPPDCAGDSTVTLQYFLESPGTTASLTATITCKTSHQVLAGASDFGAYLVDDRRRSRRY